MKTCTLVKFGAAVRALRQKRGLSLDDVCYWSGLSERTVREIEHGRVCPRATTLQALEAALETDTVRLLLTCGGVA